MKILRNAQSIGLSAQINTTVTRHNVDLLPEMVKFVEEVGAVQWSVFFLVPTGRGQIADMISPEEHERVFNWLYDLSQRGTFDIKSTAAPMYRRVAIERKRAAGEQAGGVAFQGETRAGLPEPNSSGCLATYSWILVAGLPMIPSKSWVSRSYRLSAWSWAIVLMWPATCSGSPRPGSSRSRHSAIGTST